MSHWMSWDDPGWSKSRSAAPSRASVRPMSARSAAETPTRTTGTPSSQVSIRTMLVRPSAICNGNSLRPSSARTTLGTGRPGSTRSSHRIASVWKLVFTAGSPGLDTFSVKHRPSAAVIWKLASRSQARVLATASIP